MFSSDPHVSFWLEYKKSESELERGCLRITRHHIQHSKVVVGQTIAELSQKARWGRSKVEPTHLMKTCHKFGAELSCSQMEMELQLGLNYSLSQVKYQSAPLEIAHVSW